MNKKLKTMMEKSSFAAYRLTKDGCLEIQGYKTKTVEHFFLFDGENYYFNNQLVQFSSCKKEYNDLIFAMTDTKLLIPQKDEDYLYIARNHMAQKDLVVVVMYYCDGLLYYTIVSGKGSGRVHPICLQYTQEAFSFCFHFAVDAIASVNPKMAETLYADLKQKCKEAKSDIDDQE